jgi:hypothetical protein
MTKMSQYGEALARLESPEREPRVETKILFGPQRKNFHGARHFNKIMKESQHSRLPKYALPQRLPIVFTDKTNTDNTYLLNEGFTFCEGDRKSIGVRRIDVWFPEVLPLIATIN